MTLTSKHRSTTAPSKFSSSVLKTRFVLVTQYLHDAVAAVRQIRYHRSACRTISSIFLSRLRNGTVRNELGYRTRPRPPLSTGSTCRDGFSSYSRLSFGVTTTTTTTMPPTATFDVLGTCFHFTPAITRISEILARIDPSTTQSPVTASAVFHSWFVRNPLTLTLTLNWCVLFSK